MKKIKAKSSYYRVQFLKYDSSKKSEEFLGAVEVDLTGVCQHFTLTAKAFRQAPPKCLHANLVKIERV